MVPTAVKVLLVDDSAVLRRLADATLSSMGGYEVDQAKDAFDALALMGEKDYEVLLTDYYMPGMDGVELIRRTRNTAAGNSMCIVMVTTEHDPFVQEEARKAGVDDFLLKPLDPSRLGLVLDRLVQDRRGSSRPIRIDAQSILDSFPYPAMVLDADHNVVLGNTTFWSSAETGIDDQGVICTAVMHCSDEVPCNCPLDDVLRGGSPTDAVIQDETGDLLVSVYPLPARGDSGEPLFLHLSRPAD